MDTIFSYLTLEDVLILRNVSKIYDKMCKKYNWNFINNQLPNNCNLQLFRKMFPCAIGLNIKSRLSPLYKDFKYLQGIKYLNISCCNCKFITLKTFKYLKGIIELDVSGCSELIGGNNLFYYLSSIKVLNIKFAGASNLQNNDFTNLYNLEILLLDTTGSNFMLTDDIFKWITNLRVLQCCWGYTTPSPFSFKKLRLLPKLECIKTCCIHMFNLTDEEYNIFLEKYNGN